MLKAPLIFGTFPPKSKRIRREKNIKYFYIYDLNRLFWFHQHYVFFVKIRPEHQFDTLLNTVFSAETV
ncbi:hypothetical protein KIN_28980 [Litoreibacter roseus]|uniref:Uncharacterized protein n=1 Tax=Litoreibacter roseus TaxID=2601869 RepID=A0A6N6JI87_9RHOB|nr:hypothetical protein KIN_28980 [Litoreibacter roseus]